MLLNWKHCKQFTLDYASRSRAHKFTRVSGDVKELLEAYLRTRIRLFVDSHPGKGTTLKAGDSHGKRNAD